MCTNSKYTNIAFISYKREDEAWAKWLQKKLEHYKLPIEIRKKHPNLEFSERPRHVFKDTTDLSGGVLAKAIKAGLDSSKFLIVICSPRAAKSEWVCKEVQEFIDSGREEYIIPFIIDGEPNAKNKENECFPEALKALTAEKELLGINVNEYGREAAAVKVTARMFELSFDSLWQRFKKEEKRRKRNVLAALISSIFVLLSIVAYGIWTNNRMSIERNKANLANKQLLLANDSIRRQKKALQKANDSISNKESILRKAFDKLRKTKQFLALSNANLVKGNKRILAEQHLTLLAQSRMMAGVACDLVENGRVYQANSIVQELFNGKYPYTVEAEKALRKVNSASFFVFKDTPDDVYAISMSPNGKLIFSGGEFGNVNIWNTDGHCIKNITVKNNVTSIGFSHNRKSFAIASDRGMMKVFDTWQGKMIKEFSVGDGAISSVSYSPDDGYIMSCGNGNIRLWNIENGLCVRTVGEKNYTHPAFSPNGQSIGAVGNGRFVVIWDTQHWDKLNVIGVHKNKINSICFSPDGTKLASGGDNNEIKIWDIRNKKEIKTLSGILRKVETISFSPNGEFIAASDYGNAIIIWRISDGKCVKVIDKPSKPYINFMVYSQDGKSITYSIGSKICLYKLENNNIGRIFAPYSTWAVEYGFGGKYIAALCTDNHVRLWNVDTGVCFSTIDITQKAELMSLALSADGKYLAIGGFGGKIKVWDLLQKKWLYTLIADESADIRNVSSLCFSPDSKYLASGSWDRKIKIWRLIDGKCVIIKGTLKGSGIELSYSPNGRKIAFSDFDILKIWSISNNTQEKELTGHIGAILTVRFSPSGKYIATGGSDNTIRIWNATTGQCLKVLEGHTGSVNTVCFSRDEKKLLSGSNDKSIKLWDLSTAICLQTYYGHEYYVNKVQFAPTDDYFISGSLDNTIRLWSVPTIPNMLRNCKTMSLLSSGIM